MSPRKRKEDKGRKIEHIGMAGKVLATDYVPNPPPAETEEFRGKCPVCSSNLEAEDFIINGGNENTIVCWHVENHFRIKSSIFFTAWDTFNSYLYSSPAKDRSIIKDTGSGIALLSVLMDNNIAPNKPPIDSTKWRIGKHEKTDTRT